MASTTLDDIVVQRHGCMRDTTLSSLQDITCVCVYKRGWKDTESVCGVARDYKGAGDAMNTNYWSWKNRRAVNAIHSSSTRSPSVSLTCKKKQTATVTPANREPFPLGPDDRVVNACAAGSEGNFLLQR
eukprot:255537-Prorocentrum_minimum.AAC.2